MKVAIVGAGLMGRWHATYAARAGATVVAVVDPDADAARRVAQPHGAATVAELAGVPACDAVHVCTPTQTHAALAEAALQADLHVLCEKPLADGAAATQALLDLARERDRRLCVVHQFPFQRGFRRLLARRAALGTPVRVAWETCSAGAEGRDAAGRRAVLLEILPHAVSLLCALGLDAGSLAPVAFTPDELTLAGRAGTTELFVHLSLRGRPTRNELVFTGSQGSAVLDLFHGFARFEGGRVSRGRKILRPFGAALGQLAAAGANLLRRAVARQPAYPGLPELIEAFYASVGGGPPAIDEAEMLAAAALVERVRNAG